MNKDVQKALSAVREDICEKLGLTPNYKALNQFCLGYCTYVDGSADEFDFCLADVFFWLGFIIPIHESSPICELSVEPNRLIIKEYFIADSYYCWDLEGNTLESTAIKYPETILFFNSLI